MYGGTKAFVQAVSKALRFDLLGSGVRVTDIAPGAVETEFSKVRFEGNTKKAKEVYEGFEPLTAEDIAECVLFALSRKKHVLVQSILVTPTSQASVTSIHRSKK